MQLLPAPPTMPIAAPSPVLLLIMDGWGVAQDPRVSAIEAAHTPFVDACLATRPHIRLQASEEAVGLPGGQFGNSEVGHMNIGAGRVVYQDLVRLNLEIHSGVIAENAGFRALVDYCRVQGQPLHLLGLVSDGGVHSHLDHLMGLLTQLDAAGLPQVYVHAFTDGRDTDPQAGAGYLGSLLTHMRTLPTSPQLASVCGRYYAMDRDKRWERVKLAYDLLVHGQGAPQPDAVAALQASYAAGVTDEFVLPISLLPVHIEPGHAVLFFNFRTDRGRQLTQALTQQAFPEQGMAPVPGLHFATLTQYDKTFEGVQVLYAPQSLDNGLGQYLSAHGKTQIRIAETEKYPHVTFFFNLGVEAPYPGERRIMCPSPKVATYDLQPSMSAHDIVAAILPEIEQRTADFICLNFANPDMVGHTGVWEAAVAACETVDECTRQVATAALAAGYRVLITADHGNADRMRNPDGSPHTAHTTALVPFILLDDTGQVALRNTLGKLGDIAPTVLALMGLPQPEEMTGESLVELPGY